MIRRLVGALALVAIGIPVPVAAAPVQPTSAVDGPCTDNVGITIVVDFQELGGGVNVRCAPGPVSSGLDALDQAGIVWQGTLRFPGLVCRIAGKPGADTEACGNAPPLSAYWGYWVAPRGGQWCFSNVGAGNRKPPPGTVEGWSFAQDRSAVNTPPPGFAPPPPIDGQPPNPLNRSDCGAAASQTPTPTTAAPPATPSTASTATVPQPVSTDASEVPAAPPAPSTTVKVASNPASPTSSTTTPVAVVDTSVGTTTTEATTESATSTSSQGTAVVGSTTSSVSSVDSAVVLGTVDLGDDGRGGGGFGAATVIGIIVAGSLIAAGVWAARRRRQLA